ncbi:MAG: hypothetical protein IJX07_03685 [Bacillales bacterium]|nr:hypothetical protein [Bacillales bacterium]
MKVKVVFGSETERVLNQCYDYIIEKIIKERAQTGDSDICKSFNRGAGDQGLWSKSTDRGLQNEDQ